ncbi:carboxynorspermidine decarboxylase [Litorivicinus lipolyticus]|uniref:Carboxynorspermidine/carboxyspermidine decarboxylase n=1 Tax=Litorivicinus lipolyticus TaxID=418701 RepID=A0A5Q2QA11_9GAMM|nr:carboxynorspermidine decarboxylase [Litorivicinus lipolyticus]QGG81158.1 carboxynorspermidine decarboxylase [Litorivicinus lipolyticus]
MNSASFVGFDPSRVPSPSFVIDVAAIESNLQVLADVQARSGARVLAALKAFSVPALGALTRQYLCGTCSSGVHEALLAHRHYGGEVHVFSAAFKDSDMDALLPIADHLVFNSVAQLHRFRERALAAGVTLGIRINPEHSEGAVELYDPCAPCSRLGIPAAELVGADLAGITGLHFHTLCEQGYAPLARTLAAVEAGFGALLADMEWVNFGGGHHITAPGYDIEGLIAGVRAFSERHSVQVYLEPGEAVAIRSGVLVAEVLDTPRNGIELAILDTSATCHMPDTLEMPYRAEIFGAAEAGVKAHSYRLGGQTCLAGDVIGDYSFDQPLALGRRLMFDDMAHYTLVKTNTFNGIELPSLVLWDSRDDSLTTIAEFGYADFARRLGG